MGHVERRHRHLIDTAIAMINHAGLLSSMWDFRVLTACYMYNQNTTPLLQGRSPLETMFNRVPEYSKFKVFGSKCFPCLRPYGVNKLGIKSVPCVFIGYAPEQDAYLCINPVNRRVYSINSQLFEDSGCKGDNTIREVSPKSTIIGLPIVLSNQISSSNPTSAGSEFPSSSNRVIDISELDPDSITITQSQGSANFLSDTTTQHDEVNDATPVAAASIDASPISM